MKIKSGVRQHKIEYTRKRNKCPCCTRLNCREEILRRIEVQEADEEINGDCSVMGTYEAVNFVYRDRNPLSPQIMPL